VRTFQVPPRGDRIPRSGCPEHQHCANARQALFAGHRATIAEPAIVHEPCRQCSPVGGSTEGPITRNAREFARTHRGTFRELRRGALNGSARDRVAANTLADTFSRLLESTMRLSRLLGSAIVLASTLLLTDASASQQVLTNYQHDAHWIHIDEPNVNAAQTFLPIVVYKGDRVWIRAGGCAQTGGSGKTWKRYVNPSGPNSYRLYHGQIEMPGAVEGLTNLDALVGGDGGWSREFEIGGTNFAPGRVSIGYTDDDYSDNGYWGHDNGTEDQCNGVGNAWLEMYICRADASHGATC
jgi:hypothetical protein